MACHVVARLVDIPDSFPQGNASVHFSVEARGKLERQPVLSLELPSTSAFLEIVLRRAVLVNQRWGEASAKISRRKRDSDSR